MADNGFIEKISRLLGIDKKEVETMTGDMSVNALMDAFDAVSKNDKEKLKQMFSSAETESQDDGLLSPLLDKSTSSTTQKQQKYEKDHEFNIGDEVMVGDDEGVVKIPNGPRDTIGVMIDGELKMIKKTELEESVMGMTMMPALKRMQELAGMPVNDMVNPIEVARVQTVDVPGTEEMQGPDIATQTDVSVSDCPLACIKAAFDTIETNICDIKVKDAKEIRSRINSIMMKLNESYTLKV